MCHRSTSVHEAGFTIIELLVVLAILAIVATISYPIINRPNVEFGLRATAYQIASQLRAARGAAIKTNSEYAMTIDVSRRLYWVDGLTKPQQIPDSITVDFITLQQEQITRTRARLRFRPDGSATGGNVVLTARGRRAVVEVDWLTGNSRVVWSK